LNKKGLLIVLSSPSGGGKTAILQEIIRRRPKYLYSISSTTRPPRGYEVNGKDYNFISEAEFQRKIETNEFIEWAEVHGFLYGTDRPVIEEWLRQGQFVLLDLDVKGGSAIMRQYPDNSVAIFIDPPSIETLRLRLTRRGSESEAEIERRLARLPMEMKMSKIYPHHVINDDFKLTVQAVLAIIDSVGHRKG